MEALDIYHQGEGFYYAAVLCKRKAMARIKSNETHPIEDGPTFKLFSPIFTLMAFSTELYLKALVLDEKKKQTRGHDLVDLFKQLKIETQTEIKNEYDTAPDFILVQREIMRQKGLPTLFEECLSHSRKSFERQRYSYEPSGNNPFLLEDIISSIRSFIYNSRHHWRDSSPPIQLN